MANALSWKVVLAVAVVAGVGIFVAFPGYLSLMRAESVDDFAEVLDGRTGRATVAVVMDVVFAFLGGRLYSLAFKALATGVVRVVGVSAAVGAAAADEVENVILFRNVRDVTGVEQSAIDAMMTASDIKWALFAITITLLIAVVLRRQFTRRDAASA